MSGLDTVSVVRSHGGTLHVVKHPSRETGTDMTFSVFVPPQADDEAVGAAPRDGFDVIDRKLVVRFLAAVKSDAPMYLKRKSERLLDAPRAFT